MIAEFNDKFQSIKNLINKFSRKYIDKSVCGSNDELMAELSP